MYDKIAQGFKKEFQDYPASELPNFREALKTLRSEKAPSPERPISILELSQKTGIKPETLHSIENGASKNPPFDKLEKIASAFGITLLELIERARQEFPGNAFKTTASQRWMVSFELDQGFSVYSFVPPGVSRRDFFIGRMDILGRRKLRHWKFVSNSKVLVQLWEGLLLIKHGNRDIKINPNETLYFDASIPHSFENLSADTARLLLVTYPPLF